MARIGIIVCTFNDFHLSQTMYSSLAASMPVDEPYALVCIDGGSTDDSVDFWQSKCSVLGPHDPDVLRTFGRTPEQMKSFAACLNLGIEYLEECDYIVQIHPDMVFIQPGWANKMAEYLDDHPDVGRVASEQLVHASIEDIMKRKERPGNNPCMCFPKATIEKLNRKYGYVYDEGFTRAGGWEDWDLNRRIIALGLRVMITPTAVIKHPGMSSRKYPGSAKAETYNAQHYFKKYGDYKCPV
jgi:GT2 family glycosyltransferase